MMRNHNVFLSTLLAALLWMAFTANARDAAPPQEPKSPQEPRISYHTLQYGADSAEYVKITSGRDERKPTIVFFPGSMPQPVVLRDGEASFVLPLGNFDYGALAAEFNLVVLQHPHLPAAAAVNELNDSYVFKSIDAAYHRDNRLEKYVEVGSRLVAELKCEPWVGAVVLFGHSQGAHVAAHVAMGSEDVAAVGYFSGNPMGRFAEMIVRERVNSLLNNVSREAAQQKIDELYSSWKATCAEATERSEGAENARTWTSFSRCYIGEMARIVAPLFIAYGTEDAGARTCDLLPVYLELGGKRNYAFHPFVGRGHNFEAINDSVSDFDDMAWQEAVDSFAEWIKKILL